MPPVACYTALLAVALMHPPAAAAVQGRGRTDVRALDRAFVDQRALDDGPMGLCYMYPKATVQGYTIKTHSSEKHEKNTKKIGQPNRAL